MKCNVFILYTNSYHVKTIQGHTQRGRERERAGDTRSYGNPSRNLISSNLSRDFKELRYSSIRNSKQLLKHLSIYIKLKNATVNRKVIIQNETVIIK